VSAETTLSEICTISEVDSVTDYGIGIVLRVERRLDAFVETFEELGFIIDGIHRSHCPKNRSSRPCVSQ
jgi:hypothetical protein